ncbi:hypothetical protein JCM3766R1_001602 [Sporobolomyces carnicolor]
MPREANPTPRTVSTLVSSFLLWSTAARSTLASPPPAFDRNPLLTLTSSSTPYVCVPTSACLPCPASEMESPVCSVWGNKRSLTCQPYQSLHPSPIDDPDAQSYRTTDSSPSTTTGAVAPSEFYEYEPQGSSSSDVDAGEDESGTIRKAGYDSSDELDNVKGEAAAAEMAELRDVMEAERRKRRRRSDFAREDVRIVYLDRRALDQGGQGSVDTFEACPKVVKREQSDYFEFVLCNLFFALAGLAVLLYRQRTLAGRQFGKLVARIMQTEIR